MFAAVCPKNSNEWKVEGEIGGQIVSQTQTANAWMSQREYKKNANNGSEWGEIKNESEKGNFFA